MRELDPLSSGDTLFLDIETEVNPMAVGACLIFESGPLATEGNRSDFARIRQFIESRVMSQRRYRQTISTTPIEGRLIWVDVPNFDIDDHLGFERLPAGADEDNLRTRSAQFVAERIDLARPLWEVRVIEGFALDRVAMVIKAHHCLADGVAGIELLQSLLSTAPIGDFEPAESVACASETRWTERLRGELDDRIEASGDLLRRAARVLRQPDALVDSVLTNAIGFLHILQTQRRPVSQTFLDAPNSSQRRLDWLTTEMARIAEIRKCRGGTVNDVVIATLALMLGRILRARGVSIADQKQMELRVAVPMNMRTNSSRAEIGNRVSMVFAKLPVGEPTALSTFEQTRASLSFAKESHVAQSLESILALGEWVPRRLTRRLTRRALQSHPANLVVTNVRGPNRPLYLLESRLLASYPIVPLMPGQTLGVAVLSYSGHLYWGFHSDKAHFPLPVRWSHEASVAFDDLYSETTRS